MMVRSSHVAGYFYPNQREALQEFLRDTLPTTEKKPAKAILVPHAGYVYSGSTAAKVYASVELTKTVLILGPNHTGRGAPFSLMREGAWETPLGQVPIDQELGKLLVSGPGISSDIEAHLSEHAIEVQIPFLQYLCPGIRFVPLTIGTTDVKNLREVGLFVGKVLSEFKEKVLIILSSDMNHYEDEKTTLEKDQTAISAMLALDEAKLGDVVVKDDISMCGFAPAYLGLVAMKFLGARKAELVYHTTSGPTSGDYQRVVGYAGMIFD